MNRYPTTCCGQQRPFVALFLFCAASSLAVGCPAGCGKLQSFGMAPGAERSDGDGGIIAPPPPPGDGGACVGVADAGLPYAADESEEFFEQYVFDAVEFCADCHFNGMPPRMTAATAHDVMRQEIALDAGSVAETKAGQLFQLDGATYPNHERFPFPDNAKANARIWIENHLFGPCAGGTPVQPVVDAGTPPPDAGLCEDKELDGSTIAQLAAQMSDDVFEAFRSPDYCTNCHVDPQAEGGFQYVAANKASLTQTLLLSGRIEAGRTPTFTTLGHYLNLGAPENPVEGATGIHVVASSNLGFTGALRASTEDFLRRSADELALVSCNPPDGGVLAPDAGDLDAGPTDVDPTDVNIVDVVPADAGDCAPQPYANADSVAFFTENLLAATRTCAYCHYAGQPPTMNDANAHDVMKAKIQPPSAATAAATEAGKIYHVDGTNDPDHTHAFGAPAQAKTWIDNHLHGVLPPGCD